jgi:hypothetical protein
VLKLQGGVGSGGGGVTGIGAAGGAGGGIVAGGWADKVEVATKRRIEPSRLEDFMGLPPTPAGWARESAKEGWRI